MFAQIFNHRRTPKSRQGPLPKLSKRNSESPSRGHISPSTQFTLTTYHKKHCKSPLQQHHPPEVRIAQIQIFYNNLMTRNWFHSLPSQRFQALLTLFPKSFSPFLHSTCLLSVSSQYLGLGEDYLPFSAPFPKYATQK